MIKKRSTYCCRFSHQRNLELPIASITKSFSDFAKMPVNEDSEIDVVENVRRSLDIFSPEIVHFYTNKEKIMFYMDPLYLTRIVTNIVKNGIQAIPEDRAKKIDVHLQDEAEKFYIVITDNGDRIPEELQERIFKQNFTTKSAGMGLGLSMVKKIVEDYRGKIWFRTDNNMGTTFFVEFNKTNL